MAKRNQDPKFAQAARAQLAEQYDTRAGLLDQMQKNAQQAGISATVQGALGVLKDRAKTFAQTARKMNGGK